MYWYPDECTEEDLAKTRNLADNVFLWSALGLYIITILLIYFGIRNFSWVITIPVMTLLSLGLRITKVSSTRVREAIKSFSASDHSEVFGLDNVSKIVDRPKVNFAPFKDLRVLLFSYVSVTIIVTFWYGLGYSVSFLLERI